MKEIEVLERGKELDFSKGRKELVEVRIYALLDEMYCILNGKYFE